MSDIFHHDGARTTRKVSQVPGGASSISFGEDSAPPATPTKPVTAVDIGVEVAAPAAAPEAPAASAPASEEALEALKLKVVSTITKINKDTPEVRDALSALMKMLEVSGAVEKPAAAVDVDAALAALTAALVGRGSHGIVGLGRKFRSMDDSGDKKLSFEEFHKALVEMKLNLAVSDIHRLFRSFDTDCNGYLSFDELLVGIRGQLNAKRLEMVKLAFKVLDKTGDGQITMADIEGRYDASRHPDVVSGIKGDKEVLLEFMSTFEAQGGGQAGDGVVTFDEFCKYYGSVSASVDDDEYFELMIRNVWHISGGEGWCANTTCKRVLVVQEDGTQSVHELTDDFDIDTKDMTAVKKKLTEQGIPFKSVALYGMDISSLGPAVPGAVPPQSPAGTSSGTPGSNSNRAEIKRHNMRSSITFG